MNGGFFKNLVTRKKRAAEKGAILLLQRGGSCGGSARPEGRAKDPGATSGVRLGALPCQPAE